MTTFVKIGNSVGIESRVTSSSEIVSDKFKKYVKRGDYVYFFIGCMGNFELLIDAILDGSKSILDEYLPGVDVIQFNLTNGEAIHHYHDNEFKRYSQCELTDTYFLGCGYAFAAGAYQGLKGKFIDKIMVTKVLEATIECDCKSGGDIHVFESNQ